MDSLGRHILVEFNGCTPDILNDVEKIEKSMVDAARKAGATVIQSTFHHFSPFGVSGVVVIQESHLAIHTWPEYQYAAVDLFTCGDTVDPWISFDHLKEAFEAKNHSALEMYRGALSLLKRVDFNADHNRKQLEEALVAPKFQRNLWFTDKDENQAFSLRHSGNILFNETSPFQQVRVLESHSHGKFLAINNMVMCTERDEQHYHEMIVHPALLCHKAPKRALVIGGGDGGTIREIFKHKSIEQVVMVEIDETVVNASKAHLPTLSKEFSNPKLELKIADGIEYVKKAKPDSFDIVIVDGSDPVGPAEGLFTHSFYQDCARILSKDGVLITQGESPLFHENAFIELNHCLKDIFGKESVHTLLFYAPTYPTGMWSLQMATKAQMKPEKDFAKDRAKDLLKSNSLKYYNEGIHAAAFQLPNFVKEMLEG
ncbi:MAG: polyamine aminopropyltransferase [Oligoflexia bacterium]|nr:polyamine aminopropyltransferase [Oligoflexia bacterium]